MFVDQFRDDRSIELALMVGQRWPVKFVFAGIEQFRRVEESASERFNGVVFALSHSIYEFAVNG